VLQLLVQALILVGLGFAIGMRGSVAGVGLGVVITLLVGGACAAASNDLPAAPSARPGSPAQKRRLDIVMGLIHSPSLVFLDALAMSTKDENVMAPVVNVVMMPILLLSGILLPMTLGAGWLQHVSDFMPFRYIVDAARDAFTGDLGSSDVLWGSGWAVLIFAFAMWWGATVFRKENA
jgi:ABC-2 type transport system permease protein